MRSHPRARGANQDLMARETTDPRFVLGIEFSSMDERARPRERAKARTMRFRLTISLCELRMKRPFASQHCWDPR